MTVAAIAAMTTRVFRIELSLQNVTNDLMGRLEMRAKEWLP